MAVSEELSIVDLLKVQVRGCVGSLSYPPLSEFASDPILSDILTFARTVIPEDTEHESSSPSHPHTKEEFFGISLGKEVAFDLEQLTSFIHSQVNPQLHTRESQKPSTSPQHSPAHSAVTTHSHALSPTTQHSLVSPLQLSPAKYSDQHALLSTASLGHPDPKTPTTKKPDHSHNTTSSYLLFSQDQHAQVPELEFHPSPSKFFKETQKEHFTPDSSQKSSGKQTQKDIREIVQSVDHKPEKYHDKIDSSAAQNQKIQSSADCKESLGENHNSYLRSQEADSLIILPTSLDCRGDAAKIGTNARGNKKDHASPSKGSLIESSQSSRKDQVVDDEKSSKSHNVDDKMSSKSQVGDDKKSSKSQDVDDKKSSKSEVVDDKKSSRKQKEKASQSSVEGQVIAGVSHKKDEEVKARTDSSRSQEVGSGMSSKRTLRQDAAQSSSKEQVKEDLTSHKGQGVESSSKYRKDPHIKAVPNSHTDHQTTASSETSKEQENKHYKLPFISTDEQENKDNEDPRWMEQAMLSTDEERYRWARKLWKNPSVPDPNRNLTTFNTRHLKTMHFPSSSGSRKRQRSQWWTTEYLPPRKRQCRFENVDFSTSHIIRSKCQVLNEYLGTIQLPDISRQAAKKMENSHSEKQYMLDLAAEEVRAIHHFYRGLPDQNLTQTQEEVEMGWEATKHVYEVFGRMYGYNGQQFFP